MSMMNARNTLSRPAALKSLKSAGTVQLLLRQKFLYLMMLPALIWVVVFCYGPMFGLYMAFTDYRPIGDNFWKEFFGAPFIGLEWFGFFFTTDFYRIMRNTIVTSTLSLLFSFPMPIILALCFNEIKNQVFKRVTQTVSYLPYFISWVIAANLFVTMLSGDGVVNQLLLSLGIIDEKILFFMSGPAFWFIIAVSNTWKGMGYNSIIYLSAISSIPAELYESANIDGANRFHKIRYITLPSLKPTIVILLILSLGGILNAGFDQQYLMQNPSILDYSEVIDTYTYKYGLQQSMLSYGAAVGLFKSMVSFVLLLTVNKFAKKINGDALF